MLDRFHLTIGQYARLTDRQIFDLYLHARTSEGQIDPAVPLLPNEKDEPPEPPATLESEMAALDALADALKMPGAKREELRTRLTDKYAKKIGQSD